MLRRMIAGLVLVGMAIGVWILWPGGTDPDSSSATTQLASEPTTPPASSAPPTIAPVVSSTTDTMAADHVVDSVEEAEAILRELWFGWFEGIYDQDEDRIREVVATEEAVETARSSFGIEFEGAPMRDQISFSQTEILRSDRECLVVWTVMTLTGFRSGDLEGVQVIRQRNGQWVQLSIWSKKGDLWEADCESLLY